jgi:uncharacterized protein
MRKSINHLAPVIELVSILFIAFGFLIISSIFPAFISSSDNSGSFFNYQNEIEETSTALFSIIVYEVFALGIIILILKYRGWKFSDFNLQFSFRLFLVGILLFYTDLLLNLLLEFFIHPIPPPSGTSGEYYPIRNEANWISIILIVIINSIYEESILIGYLFKRLEKIHPVFVVVISLTIRELYHTYQGWISLINITSMGLIFGFYYYKFRKLWPVIIAHGCHNLVVYSLSYFR